MPCIIWAYCYCKHSDNKVVVRTDIPTRRVASCSTILWPNGWKDEDATEVDLHAGHIVLDGFPALRKRCTTPPLLDPCLLWPRSPISAPAELLFVVGIASCFKFDARIELRECQPVHDKLLSQVKSGHMTPYFHKCVVMATWAPNRESNLGMLLGVTEVKTVITLFRKLLVALLPAALRAA